MCSSDLILGPTTEGVFAHMDNVYCVSVAKRKMPCVGCWFGGGYFHGHGCSLGCCAMSNVTPEMVLAEIMSVV